MSETWAVEVFPDPITGEEHSRVVLAGGSLILPYRRTRGWNRIVHERQEKGVKLRLLIEPSRSSTDRHVPWDRLGRKDADWLFEGYDAQLPKPELGSPVGSVLLRTRLNDETLYLDCTIWSKQCSGRIEDLTAGRVEFRMTLNSVDEPLLGEGVELLAKTLRQLKGQQPWYEWAHQRVTLNGEEVEELSGPFGLFRVPQGMHVERDMNHPIISADLSGPDYSAQMSVRFTHYPFFFRAEELPDDYRLVVGAFEGIRAYRLRGPEGAGVRGAYYYFGDTDGLQWIPNIRFTCTHQQPAQPCRGGANFRESGVVTYVFSGDYQAALSAIDEALGKIAG